MWWVHVSTLGPLSCCGSSCAHQNWRSLLSSMVSAVASVRFHPPTMSNNLTTEQQVAVAAVKRACVLTASVFNHLVKGQTLVKGDKSPVTGACSTSS
jgi:hypothetical protein